MKNRLAQMKDISTFLLLLFSYNYFLWNEYHIIILFDKKFNDSYDNTEKNPIFYLHYSDYNMYQLQLREQDTIPPPDSVKFCFNYFLKYDSTIISDTLLLIKKSKSPDQ